MEHPADESVVKNIPLNNPKETPMKENPDAPETPNVVSTQFVGLRCQIPSLWKRFGAELIDFILTCLIKSVLRYFGIDIYVGIDFTKYKPIVWQDDYNMDYPKVVLSYIIFVLDISYEIVIYIIGIYWLHGSTLFHGGGTIGKSLLSLTVVRADKLYNILDQPNDIIALTPGSCLDWKCAIHRSLAKNFFYSLMYPLPFATAAANQNRCVYDLMCGTIVVEVLQPLRCDQSIVIPVT